MPSDSPFSEAGDSDRTVYIPMPGGVRPPPPPPAPPPPSLPPAAPADPSRDEPFPLAGSGNTLVAAAGGLLALLARVRTAVRAPDQDQLRERASRELGRFERAATEAGYPREQLVPAHYALCASLDDVVMATAWGGQGAWKARSLCATFHRTVVGGEGFFDFLEQMKKAPALNLAVLELFHICLSLGFQGKYQLLSNGRAERDRVREDLYALIARVRGAVETGLSPHWQGVDAPYRPRRGEVPLWVAAAAGLAIVGAAFLWVQLAVSDASSDLTRRLDAVPPLAMPAIFRPPTPVVVPPHEEAPELDRLRRFLEPEIREGLVTVLGTESVPVVRITGSGMFDVGSSTVLPRFASILGRIGTALNTEPGRVTVAGYTDNQPVHTRRFPSNYELSLARAQAAAAIIGAAMTDPARLLPDGRGEADPLAPNDTPAGQARNRRTEVILHRPG